MIVTAGSTNRSLYFYIQEDAGATNPGEPVTGLLFSSLDAASYARQGGARVAITLATLASASAAHSDGGFILVDDTNMPGLYRLDVPDLAFATGVDQVIVQIDPGAARVCAPVLVDITDFDLRTSSVAQTGDNFARLGAPAGASVSADIADLPTVSEFNARTRPTADYFDQTTDPVELLNTGGSAGTSADELVDDVIDEVLTGATHDVADSLGRRVREIQDDTEDIQTRLPSALSSGRMRSDFEAISGDSVAADVLEALMDGSLIAQVNDASATITDFAADGFTEATDDHFNGRLITFITGALRFQQTDIADYDAAGGAQGSQQFTVTALTEAPANNDFFVIH